MGFGLCGSPNELVFVRQQKAGKHVPGFAIEYVWGLCGLFQNVHTASRSKTDNMRKTDLGALDLPVAAFAA